MRAESQEDPEGEQNSDRAGDDTEPEEVAVVRKEVIDPQVHGAEVRINRLPENWGPRIMRRRSRTSEPGSQSSSEQGEGQGQEGDQGREGDQEQEG